MSKVILIKAQTRQVTAVKYFTLRADRNQDGEESLVNLSNVDSADVPRVIHQICFSFLRLLPCVWVFIKKSFQPTKKPKHLHLLLPPSKKKKKSRGFICNCSLVCALCWAFLEEMWFQEPLLCFRSWLTSWNWEEQAGNAQLKSSLLSVWQNYEHSFFEASDKCQEKLNF